MLTLFEAQTECLHFCNTCWSWSSSSLSNWRIRADSLGSVCQGVDDTKLSSQVVVTVPVKEKICMCGLSVYSKDEGVEKFDKIHQRSHFHQSKWPIQ